MRPEAALELVGKYARLQRRINLIKTEIGQALDPCPGIGNKRARRLRRDAAAGQG